MAGPPILNPIANEVYLNFESSTPCLADRHFNYTSLIAFHCKRGVSMVSEHWFTRSELECGSASRSRRPTERCARARSACLALCGVWDHFRPSVQQRVALPALPGQILHKEACCNLKT